MPRRSDLILLVALGVLCAIGLFARPPWAWSTAVDRVSPIASSAGGSVRVEGGAALMDVNLADAALLEDLPGIGPTLAERIVKYRDAHGPFASVDALADVKGIGKKTVDLIRGQVCAGP